MSQNPDDTSDSNTPTRQAGPVSQSDDDPSTSKPGRHQVGDIIGERYRVESVLGEGAMGTVYLAEHTAMRKTVAIKSLHRRFTRRDEFLERFRREAQAAGNIQHQNICQATDFIDARTKDDRADDDAAPTGSVYLVMEYLQGRTLTEVIDADGPLPPHRAAHFAAQILDGLDAAHQAGVVHRDLKPDNIMLVVPNSDDEADRPIIKLMDFGIARVRMDDDAETLTRAGEVYGTPHYMAPEQAAGDEVDRRADLYATGIILFVMLTGRPPYEDDKTARVISMHITEQLPAIQDASPHLISEDLRGFVRKLTAKEAGDRFQTAAAARNALDGLDLQARSTTTLDRVTRSVRGLFSDDHKADTFWPFSSSDAEETEPNTGSEGSSESSSDDRQLTDALRRSSEATLEYSKAGAREGKRALKQIARSSRELAREYNQLDDEARITIRRGLLLLVTLAVVAATLLGYLWLRSPAPAPDPIDEQLETERQSFATDRDVDLGNNGELDRVEAAAALDALPDSPSGAHANYLLSRAHMMRGEHERALEAYRRTVGADSSYFADDELLDDLIRLTRRDDDIGQRATSLVASYTGDRYLLGHLGERAYLADRSSRQQRAFDLLDEHGGLSELPDWMRASIAMRQASDCDAWQRHIDRLVALGEPRGADVLQWHADRPHRGCGFLKSKDCYSCIRDRLPDAIDALK